MPKKAKFVRHVNSESILLHATTKWRSRKEDLDDSRSYLGNARGKHRPKNYWAKAVSTTVYLLNQTLIGGAQVSRDEAYFKRKPNMAHVQVFNSIAYVHVAKKKRKKLDSKAEKCILIQYSHEQKGYKCYNL